MPSSFPDRAITALFGSWSISGGLKIRITGLGDKLKGGDGLYEINWGVGGIKLLKEIKFE
ncbi:hypothetical protein ES703_11641 [subsurface metagenome]